MTNPKIEQSVKSIGALHWAYFPFIGGVERHLATVLPEIVNKGVKVSALSGQYAGEPQQDIVDGVHLTREQLFQLQHIKLNKDSIDPAQVDKMFRKFVDQAKPEVIFAHNLHFNYPGYAESLIDLANEKGIPTSLVLHNDVFVGQDYPTTKSIVSMGWDRLTSISLFLTAVTAQEHPTLPTNFIETIPHGIDADVFRPFSDAEKEEKRAQHGWQGRKIIINHSKMIEKKGALETVLAIAKVKENHPEVLLLLCGGTPAIADSGQAQEYWAKIQTAIKEHGLEDNVVIQLYPTLHEIRDIVALSDVAIQSSIKHEEPFGLCPVEAMSCGVPVIATRSGGIPESMIDQVTGFLVDKEPLADVPEAIAARLDLLLSNKDLRIQMGKAGREQVLTHFTKEIMADRFIASANSLINNDNR